MNDGSKTDIDKATFSADITSNVHEVTRRSLKDLFSDASNVLVTLRDDKGNEMQTTRGWALVNSLYEDALDSGSKTRHKSANIILERVIGKPGNEAKKESNDMAKVLSNIHKNKIKQERLEDLTKKTKEKRENGE